MPKPDIGPQKGLTTVVHLKPEISEALCGLLVSTWSYKLGNIVLNGHFPGTIGARPKEKLQVTVSMCQPLPTRASRIFTGTRFSFAARHSKVVGRDIAT